MKIKATAIEPNGLTVNNSTNVILNATGITPSARTNVYGKGWIPGKSAYEVWLDQGNTGTELDFLNSLIGEPGNPGLQGIPGPAGGSYNHSQSVPSALWTITHNLGYNPGGILVTDSSGRNVEGEVAYTNTNSLTITFTAAFSGTAYLS